MSALLEDSWDSQSGSAMSRRRSEGETSIRCPLDGLGYVDSPRTTTALLQADASQASQARHMKGLRARKS